MKSEVGSLSHRCELVVPTDATILAMVDKLQQTNSHLKVYKVYWYFPFRWKVRWTSEIKNVKLLDSLAQHSTFIHGIFLVLQIQKMHGRVKVKSTAQQQEEKRIEREGKLKSYRSAITSFNLLYMSLRSSKDYTHCKVLLEDK